MEIVIQVGMAMLATLAFSVLFNAPVKHLFFCSVVGGVAWLLFILVRNSGYGIVAASFVAALGLTICGRILSYQRKAPVTVFLIAGFFPLVPGAGIYYTAYFIFIQNYSAAFNKGVETLMIAGAIVLGILFGFSLPKKLFSIFSGNKPG